MSKLQEVESIGYYFLGYCYGLKEIDLSGLKQVKSIGQCFLSYCEGLEKIKEIIEVKYPKLYDKVEISVKNNRIEIGVGIKINDCNLRKIYILTKFLLKIKKNIN